jgi:hypothetical protein
MKLTKATRQERLTLLVYHLLKAYEALIFIGSVTLLQADEVAAKWLFSRDD